MLIFKWLLEVFNDLMPNIEHRFCIMHMHANFKNDVAIVRTLKELMWNATRAYKKNKKKYYTEKINSICNNGMHFYLNLIHGISIGN